jgi:hypothetical protein
MGRFPGALMTRSNRGLYVAAGALLTTAVLTAGSLLTFLVISPQIEKGKDRTNLDVVKNVLLDLDANIRELLAKSPNSTRIFTVLIPKGELRADPDVDLISYSIKTTVDYDTADTSTLQTERNQQNDVLTIRDVLPVDLVTRNTKIRPGRYVVSLTFEREAKLNVSDWKLHRNATFNGTVSSTTGSYYEAQLREDTSGRDINLDGDTDDHWILCLSDPNEGYVFDTVAIHSSTDPHGFSLSSTEALGYSPIGIVEEGDSLRLDGVPLIVYRVRERYVVFRYAMIRMDLQ